MVILRFSDEEIDRRVETVKLPRAVLEPTPCADSTHRPDRGHCGRYREPEESAPRLLGPWVISVLLHGGVVILALFVVASRYIPQTEDEIFDPPTMEPMDMTKPVSFTSGEYEFKHEFPIDQPVSEEIAKGDPMNDLVLEKSYDPTTLGVTSQKKSTQGLPDGIPDFFGLPPGDPSGGGARNVVYVIDASGSLVDTLPYVRKELVHSIQKLFEGGWVSHYGKAKYLEPAAFTVIFYQNGEAREAPEPHPGMKRALPRIKDMVCRWVGGDRIVPHGNSNPLRAIELALSYKPDLIYILSDNITGRGQWQVDQDELMERIAQAKRKHRISDTSINTIQFLYPDPLGTLERITSEHGGRYRFVSESMLGL